MDWLLNNIAVFTVIIVAIILIAVGLILYFLVFRKKIKANKITRQDRKEKQAVATEKSKNLASSVFEEKEKEEVGPTKEELEAFDKKVKSITNQSKRSGLNTQNFSEQVSKPKDKKDDKDDDNKSGFDPMSQFKK